ncbi:MAG: DNA topoisomerase III [Patescibacteria group bacterium]|nr:DNA topoisomerase III [Patescibacteria group bacterium]
MHTVYIAEKPSVARSLAEFLAKREGSGRYSNAEGHLVLPNGDVVTYPVGHILQMEMPDAYLKDEQRRADPFSYLPLLPDTFLLHPRYERTKRGEVSMSGGKPVVDRQFFVVEKLLRKAKRIVNAGDSAREGQLIMDELFSYLGIDPDAPHIFRVAINDPSETGLKAAFDAIEPNAAPRWRNARMAGRARQEADWLVGLNATRSYWSVLEGQLGTRRFGLGRVKTPVLCMVSSRCKEVERFRPRDYFVPVVTLKDGTELRWKAREGAAGSAGFDEEGRIISKELADQIVQRINEGLPGVVSKVRNRRVSEPPPLPYNLVKLQSAASSRHGLTVSEVSKAAQSLYERHKAITYVGTECRYLPQAMLQDAYRVLSNLSPMFGRLMDGANSALKPASFNDQKVAQDEHFAIAPTGVAPSGMDAAEKAVYEMVVRRFVAQFYPDHQYLSLGIDVGFGPDQFEARARKTLIAGWRDADQESESGERGSKGGGDESDLDADAQSHGASGHAAQGHA